MHISSLRTRTLLVLCLAVLIFGTLSLKADRVFTMGRPHRSAATNESAQSPDSRRLSSAARGSRFANYFSLTSPALVPGPVLTLLKSHTLTNDVNANGYVNPGDTLQYTVTITNTGSDATSATFSETIDANATLVPGSVSTTPVAVNDSYSTIGNVSISVPAGSGLLANDFDPDGDTLTITAVNTSSTQGTLSYNAANGSFTFDPTPGYEGTTSFTYTVSDGTYTDTATVSITVSGMIWFVDNSRGTNGDGRLSNPFNSLSTFNSANNGTGNNPAANDNIFLYSGSGNYASSLTLLSGQKLIGQGATASLATITGLTPNAFSATLPSTGGTRPVIAGTVTLHNSTTTRGLNITPSSGTAGLAASSKSSVNVSEVSVTTTSATAINFSSITNGTFSFTSISASGGSNGIVLSSTTGSFTVTGNGGSCTSGSPTCSGGTIQNTTGADGASSGVGVSLTNAQNVSLSLMRIKDHSNFGIKGSNVNGLTMANCLIDGANGTSNATDDGAIYFGGGGASTGLYGTVSITNCDISGGWEDNFHVDNSDGTLNLTLSGCNIHDNSTSGGNDGLFVEADTTASVTVTANNNTFARNAGDHFQANGINSATLSVTFQNNNLSGGHPAALGQGITIGGSTFNGALNYNVSNNTMTGTLAGGAININQGSGTANFNGTISGNTIGNPAIASSGTTQSTAIRVENHGSGTHTAVITGNAVRQYDNGNGIDIVAGGSGANGGINVTVTNNTLSNPGANALHGVQVNIGTVSGNTNQACIDIQNNTLAGSGVALNSGYDVYLRQRNLTTVRLPGYGGANNNNSSVTAFVQGINPGSETALASNSVASGGGGFTGGAACAQPSAAPPAELAPAESQQSGGQVSALRSGATQPSFWSQAKRTLLSAFIAPTGYFNLSRAFDALMPAASAAELKSAAVSPAIAGETVSRNFAVIPAGKSITIRYRVTVSSPFPQGVYQISSQGALSGSNFATVLSNADATAVIVAPTISKAFGATAIPVGGSTSLTFTLTNPNPSQSLSSVAFTDNLPSGLVVATPNGLSSTCSGTASATAGSSSVSLTGGTIAAGSTCTISVNITGTSEGTKNNTTSTLTSAEADAGSAANASINVINPPTLSASFGATTVPLNGTTSLSFTVTNPNSTFSLNGLGFNLSLPAGLQVASPDGLSGSCSGTVTATAGSGSISLSGASLAASGSCTFSVNVTGTSAGVKNASTTITATETGNGNTATASITVVEPPTISVAFGAASVQLNGSTTLSYTISNPNTTVALSGVAFSNSLPAGLVVATPNGVSGSCSGTVTATAGTGSISLSGGGVAASGSCTFSVNVTGTSAGTKVNTTGTVTSTEGGTGAISNTVTLTVLAPPTLGNYSAASVTAGGNTTVTPDAAPTDLTSVTAAAAPGFTGLLTVNPATGVVRVTNAQPAGSHTITVTATGSGGTATKTFTLTVSDPNACTSASFAAPTVYPVSGGPYSVAVGDFNGDGKQDIATANQSSNTVSIRLGDGAGGLSGSTEISVGVVPRSVVIGDFNGDGKQDFATVSDSSNTVSIRLGDGAGGFSGSTEISVGVAPAAVAVGDFNGDGKQDIAVADFGSNAVSIRLGDGSGGFSGSTEISVGAGPLSVAVGDFNGDGKPDFATANSPDSTVSIRLGDGSGGFSGSTEISVGVGPTLVAVGDFNGDGKQDIAVANNNSNTVSIRMGNGSGGFSGSTEIGVGDLPFSVALGDFNGDGKLDFAATSSDSSTISVRLGNGAGGFSGTTEVGLNGSPTSVAVGDFNGDGRLDLAAVATDSAISVMLSNCTNNTAPTITAGSTVSRTQGTAAANATIATVSDNETAAGSLTVTATTVPTGITVSNITNTNGTITADIAAGCTATTGDNTVVLTVTDGGGMTATANLTVSVAANAAPTLGNYSAATVVPGGSLTVTPDAAPSDNGTIATLTAAAPGFTGTLSINAATGEVSLSNAGPTGTYTVTVTATDNCGATSTRTFTLTVSPAVTTTTVASALNPSTYGQTTSFTATVTSGGNPVNAGTVTFKDGSTVLASSVSLNSSGQASLSTSTLTAGLHTITAEYSGTATLATSSGTVSQTVNKAVLTVTADNKSKTYGVANPALTATITGFVGSDTASVVTGAAGLTTTATTASGVGTYPITAAQGTLSASNYSFSFANGTLTVSAATITVTASNASRAYGATNPAFTATYSGFVNGDTQAVLSGSPALSTTATTSSAVGTYTITAAQGTLAATNYSFAFVSGTLTIGRATLTITADNKSKAYGAALPTLTASYSGFVNGDTASVLTGAPGLTTTATTSSAVGTYPITAAAGTLAAANYDFSFVNGTLSVTTATLTVAADNKSKVYGAANPALTWTITGFVNGETASVLTGAPGVTTAATASSGTGSYAITASAGTLAAANYTFSFTNGTLTVTPATLTVTADSKAKTYGSANPTLTASFSGFVNGDTANVLSGSPDITTTALTGSNAGIYPITVSAGTLAAANYTFVFANGSLTVNKATLTVTADNKTRLYGAANPTFTVSYSGFVNGDTASVVTGSASLTTTATANSPVGSYPITAAAGTLAAANYTFTFASGTLSVTTAGLTITADNKSKTYGSANPTLTVSYSGFVNGDTESVLTGALSVTTTALQGSGVGVYPITASGLSSSNYAITYVNGSLTVNKAPLTVTANNQTKVYGAANPALTYAITGFVNGETASVLTGAPSVTTTATTASGVGGYSITAAIGTLSAANYSFTFVNGTLSVTPATLSVIADSKSKTYGAANPALTVSYSGFVNGDTASVLSGTPSLTTTALTGSNAGAYPITVSAGTLAAANYTFSFVNSTLTVNKAPLTVTADNKTRLYGAANPAFTVSYSGFVNGDTASVLTGAASLTTTATANSPVGSYPITAAAGTLAAANYTFTFVNGTLNVTTVTLTVTAENKTKTYGAANPTLTMTYSGFVNGDTASVLTGTPNVTTTATAGSAVGTYPITVTAGTLNTSNYALVFVDGTLTVSKAALTVTADSKTRAYGVANPTLTGTLSGVVNGDNITATYTTAATTLSPAGSYAITPALSDPGNKLGNYTVTTTNGVLTITKAVLTVTADNKSKTYGAANPTLTASYSGFVSGDTAAVLTGAPALTTTATTASGAGTYPITAAPGTLAAANYTFSFVNGTLTVNKATLTVTADDKTRVYGAANPTFTVSYSGFVNGDTTSALTGAAALTTTATTSSAVGDYTITAAQGTLSAANYSFSFTAGKLTVTKAALSVKANDAARAYGAANPTFTGTITGLVNGDNITASYTTTATASSAPGDYAITPSLADPASRLGNYNVTLTNGKLTIGKATLTITADNKSKVFGAANPAFTVSYSGFVNGDTASVLTGTLSLTTTATADSATGTYPITPAGVTAANYAINFVNGTLTVTAATPTVTLASGSNPSSFGQAVTFTVTVSKASQTAAAPTGTVTFRDGANAIGTGTLNAAGQATLTTSALTVGAHSLTAEYGGDGNYNAAVSVALTQTVSKAATTTTVASSVNPSTFNQSVTFTATVSSTAGTPTGSVEFRDGSTVLGTATLANGKATLTVTTLSVGDHSITAVYGGSDTFTGSTSAAITQTVKEVCTWTISPVEQLAYETGGDFEVSVSSRSDCPWAATSNVAWITIKSGASGTGNGKVIYSVTPLPDNTTRTGTLTIAGQTFTVKQTKKVVLVNSASYDGTAASSDSFVSIFGVNLTDRTEAASTIPLPDTLAGVKIKIRDSQGNEHFAQMLYASPTQINYIMPSGLPPGPCAAFIVRANEEIAGGTITIAPVAPALLSADASGKGLPAAYLVRVKADGSQVIEPVARYDEWLKQFVPVPVDLGSGNEEVFVILFGTGLRYRSDLKNVGVKIGGVDTAISYAGAQGSFIGLDQVNILIPRSLAGRGDVDVVLTVDGKTANTLKLNIR